MVNVLDVGVPEVRADLQDQLFARDCEGSDLKQLFGMERNIAFAGPPSQFGWL
jgi:hypothetical protein